MIEKDKLARIYDELHRELLVYIYGFVRSNETAQDLLHDVFVKFMRYTADHDTDGLNVKAYLYKIARNLCIDLSRRGKIIQYAPLPEHGLQAEDTTQADIEKNELSDRIESLLKGADPVARSVFLMKNELGLTYGEIAERLGISERTAKRRMSALLSEMAESIEKAGFFIFLPFFLTACAVLARLI